MPTYVDCVYSHEHIVANLYIFFYVTSEMGRIFRSFHLFRQFVIPHLRRKVGS